MSKEIFAAAEKFWNDNCILIDGENAGYHISKDDFLSFISSQFTGEGQGDYHLQAEDGYGTSYGSTKAAPVTVPSDQSPSVEEALREELAITDKLLEERQRVLDAIPECHLHGSNCVPHALEWIERAKELLSTLNQ